MDCCACRWGSRRWQICVRIWPGRSRASVPDMLTGEEVMAPTRSRGGIRLSLALLLACAVSLLADAAAPATLPRGELLSALQKGGLVIVMRHASSPREVPDRASANADNTKPERQLDQI